MDRLYRWKLLVQDFDRGNGSLRLEYRPGILQNVADALSRNGVFQYEDTKEIEDNGAKYALVAPEMVDGNLEGEAEEEEEPPSNAKDLEKLIKKYQTTDPECKAMMDYCQSQKAVTEVTQDLTIQGWISTDADHCHMDEKSGILLRTVSEGKGKVLRQLVVPIECQEALLYDFHSSMVGGHQSSERTLANLKRRYYWPGMRADIKKYCDLCVRCAKAKGQKRVVLPALKPVTAPPLPMDKCSMDILKLPLTLEGNQYLLVLIDYASKFMVMEPMENQSATKVMEALMHMEGYIGLPKEVYTDQGRQFTGQLMAAFTDRLGTKRDYTTTYHPKSNGNTERGNKTIIDRLTTLVDSKCDDWDKLIPFVQLGYNASTQETIGTTPYKLFHGRDPNLPATSPLQMAVKNFPETEVEEMEHRLYRAWYWAEQIRKAAQGRQKTQYDKRSGVPNIKVGSLVWYKSGTAVAGPKRKLASAFCGPFEVTAVNFPNAMIHKFERSKKNQHEPYKVHMDKLSLMYPVMEEKQKEYIGVPSKTKKDENETRTTEGRKRDVTQPQTPPIVASKTTIGGRNGVAPVRRREVLPRAEKEKIQTSFDLANLLWLDRQDLQKK